MVNCFEARIKLIFTMFGKYVTTGISQKEKMNTLPRANFRAFFRK